MLRATGHHRALPRLKSVIYPGDRRTAKGLGDLVQTVQDRYDQAAEQKSFSAVACSRPLRRGDGQRWMIDRQPGSQPPIQLLLARVPRRQGNKDGDRVALRSVLQQVKN